MRRPSIKFTDPDVVSLIEELGGQDPYSAVRGSANALLGKLANFEVKFDDPFERIRVLASLAGFDVKPMTIAQKSKEGRDAVLMYTSGNSKEGTIFYDPTKPKARIVFSIGHEIAHSFFPRTGVGARFRAIVREGTKSARELEMLCHFGASELTMPLAEFEKSASEFGFGLRSVDRIRQIFGTSFEACLHRMAATAPFSAAAGLFQFRFKTGENEDASAYVSRARDLFGRVEKSSPRPTRKYRRQSFYRSETFPTDLVIPWNKSIPESSGVYRTARTGVIEAGIETIPVNGRGKTLRCFIEALPAPYQPEGTEPGWPDILFLLRPYN